MTTRALCDWCGTAVAVCVTTMTYSPGNQTHFLLCHADAVKAGTAVPAYARQVRCLPLAGEPAPAAPVGVAPADAQAEVADALVYLQEVAGRAREEMRSDKHWDGHIPYGQEVSAALGGPCGDLAGVFDPDLVDRLVVLLERLGQDQAAQVKFLMDTQPPEEIRKLVERRHAELLAVARHVNTTRKARR
ncbi:hypothetical protein GCM10017673_37560 [Streptosporangium violaceochromogenes]|nr:hypothetical protein GCM10017673_37560 [Streptosporangium violaceochromogenes]